MLEVEVELREQIKDCIRHKRQADLDELWSRIVEGERRSLAFHQSILRFLLNKKDVGHMQDMYGSLLAARNKEGNHQFVLELCETLLDIEPTLGFLRPHLIDAIEGMHADRDPARLAEVMKISGLDGETPDLRKVLTKLDELLGASKGQVFKHVQWGLGVVKELDATAGWAILDFPKKPGHKMTVEGLKNFLQRIPHDHVLARMAKNPAEFKAELSADPAAALKLVLKSYGNTVKAADLKKVLTDRLLTEDEYKKWWAKAREEARLDPMIDMKGTGASVVLVLRREPRSFVDEIRERLILAKDLVERRNVLREVARHGDNADFSPDDVKALDLLFRKPLTDGRLTTDTEKLGHGLLFEEFSDLFGEGVTNPIDIDELLRANKDKAAKLIADLAVFETQRLALEHVLELFPDSCAPILAEVFLAADSKLAAWLEKTLVDQKHEDTLANCIERVLARPDRNPDVFVWAAKGVFDGRFKHLTDSSTPMEILTQVMQEQSRHEDVSRRSGTNPDKQAAAYANKLRMLLQDGHNKYLKAVIKKSAPEEAKKLLGKINYMGGLNNQLRTTVEQLIQGQHPDLRKQTRAEEEEERRRPAYHYATAEVIEQKRRDLSLILSVEMPENSKAIGTARELGDLRENAEYHAAKDRQKLLMQQAAELEDLIARARPIELSEVRIDQVRFGTRVTLLRLEDGTEETHTIMGMWEADPARGIINYMTPFGSQLMNRSPKERFSVTQPDGRIVHYEVVSIERAAQP